MVITPMLLHGALGPFDELIFSGVGIVFIVMMAISWIRSRNAPPEIDEEVENTFAPQDTADNPDHVTLK